LNFEGGEAGRCPNKNKQINIYSNFSVDFKSHQTIPEFEAKCGSVFKMWLGFKFFKFFLREITEIVTFWYDRTTIWFNILFLSRSGA
jgi:hypothetical protein